MNVSSRGERGTIEPRGKEGRGERIAYEMESGRGGRRGGGRGERKHRNREGEEERTGTEGER